jgi:D-sedoheptulose 7-phosphate isomerase
MVCGNGGSAASANHFVTELVGDFLKEKKRGIFAISLSTNSSLLTALSNDIGYENVFSRELYTIGEEGDILIAISTSGKSENVNRACKTAADKGIKVVYLTGAKNPAVADICDVIIRVPSHSTPRIQEVHDLILHIFAYLIEKEFK